VTPTATPASIPEIVDAVRGSPRVNIVGSGTKPRLAAEHGVRICTTALRGVVEYDASEYTITALAGTPVREIAAVLAERGQYLPFDPLLVDAGATLGGTVASGLSGPGRFRYGGLRDFILGVRFIDGSGRLLRVGGKVVKNAAGFDLPKFFVGSLGRFGASVEFTFKVFPRAAVTRTLEIPCASDAELEQRLMEAGNTRWEIDALDADGNDRRIFLRLAAAPSALDALTAEILSRWPGRAVPEIDAAQYWADVREFRWAHADGVWIKIATTPKQLPAALPMLRALAEARVHVSAGGNVVLLSLAEAAQAMGVGEQLRTHDLNTLTLRGDAPLFPGVRHHFDIESRIKTALDPVNRFPGLD
jgi:glycolate oxidase FAD binding subunit